MICPSHDVCESPRVLRNKAVPSARLDKSAQVETSSACWDLCGGRPDPHELRAVPTATDPAEEPRTEAESHRARPVSTEPRPPLTLAAFGAAHARASY